MLIDDQDIFALDWVHSDRYKFSYGTSFGKDYFSEDSDLYKRVKFLFGRFQAMSTRENSGVCILKKQFDYDNAALVVDPIFLIESSKWRRLAEQSDKNAIVNYAGAYILDIDNNKTDIIRHIANLENIDRLILCPDALKPYVVDQYVDICAARDYKVEDWLSFIDNSEMFFTDSFHGMCFAIILHKDFYVIFHKNSIRGYARFYDMLSWLGLEDRFIDADSNFSINEFIYKPIDYAKVDAIINQRVDFSKRWLHNSLREGMNFTSDFNAYDILMDKAYNNQALVRSLKYYIISQYLKNLIGVGEEHTVVCFGSGIWFSCYISRLLEYFEIKYVVDNDRTKWGYELYPGIKCVSPDKIKNLINPYVIIMIENKDICNKISEQLNTMGIYEHIDYSSLITHLNNLLGAVHD